MAQKLKTQEEIDLEIAEYEKQQTEDKFWNNNSKVEATWEEKFKKLVKAIKLSRESYREGLYYTSGAIDDNAHFDRYSEAIDALDEMLKVAEDIEKEM